MSAARTQAIDDAFTNVVAPALVAGGADDSEAAGIAGYLASAFAEDVRVALDEADLDGDAASDGDSAALSPGGEDSAVGTGTGTGAGAGAGASTPAKRGKLSKAERKAKRDALKKKGGLRAATGEGVFKVQRTRQVGFEKAGELLACTLPDAIADAATGVDVAALQEQLLRALVVNGAVRDVDDDGFDLVFDEAERKLEAHEVTVDATGLAVLAEDDVWHAVVVTEILEPGQRFSVLFTEYGKPQEVSRAQLVLDVDRADLAERGEGTCAMCERFTPLTAHHLIPRVTHSKWLKKGLTKEFLNTCVDICRKCHNVVHRFKDNDTLGKEYNTLEKLLAADYIQRWIAYARSRPAPTREEREAHLKLAK